jgi:hypothetical protein
MYRPILETHMQTPRDRMKTLPGLPFRPAQTNRKDQYQNGSVSESIWQLSAKRFGLMASSIRVCIQQQHLRLNQLLTILCQWWLPTSNDFQPAFSHLTERHVANQCNTCNPRNEHIFRTNQGRNNHCTSPTIRAPRHLLPRRTGTEDMRFRMDGCQE